MKELFVRHNIVGYSLKLVGLLFLIVGSLRMFIVIADAGGYGVNLLFLFMPVIYGILIIGAGELIDLLQRILNHLDPTAIIPFTESVSFSNIPLYVTLELEALYTNEEIKSIEPTANRDVYKVEVNDRTEFVDIGGKNGRVLTEEESEQYNS